MRARALEFFELPLPDVRASRQLDGRFCEASEYRPSAFLPSDVDRHGRAHHDRHQTTSDVLSQRKGRMGPVHQRSTVDLRSDLLVRLDGDRGVVGRLELRPGKVRVVCGVASKAHAHR